MKMSKEATTNVPENAPSNENSWASSCFVSSFKPPENHSKINFSSSPLLLITLPRILSAPCFLSNPQFRRIPPSLQPTSQQFPLFPLFPFLFFPCLHSPPTHTHRYFPAQDSYFSLKKRPAQNFATCRSHWLPFLSP